MLFKVLKGKQVLSRRVLLKWSLPTACEIAHIPGEWHFAEGELVACRNGLHLTEVPAEWWGEGCTIYVAESDGETITDDTTTIKKPAAVVQGCYVRLLSPN